MKTRLLALAFGLAGLVLGGCVSADTAAANLKKAETTASFERHVSAGAESVKAAIAKSARERGWTEAKPLVYSRTLTKEKDPILGVVAVSDKPQDTLQFSVALESNATGTLLRISPEIVTRVPWRDNPSSVPVRPGIAWHAEIESLVDAAVAQAAFAAK